MIKELVTTVLLTGAVSNANTILAQYSKTITYNSFAYPYINATYFEDDLESQESICYKSSNPITDIDGITQINSFILKYDWWDSTDPQDHNITTLCKYTLIQNRASQLNYIYPTYTGTIHKYESYESFNRSYCVYAGLPTNQVILNALNGTFPSSFNEYKSMINDVGIPNLQWTTIPCNSIDDIGNSYRAELMTQNYAYIVEKLIVDYDDELVNTPIPMDLTYYPSKMEANIVYRHPEAQATEVVDIPGLLFQILGMPFAWISTAFNFTIFPNTPYAVNISHIFMAVIVGGIAIFIIKRILH